MASDGPSRRGWRAVLLALLLSAAVALYLATGRLALAVFFPCLHAFWHTFQTGWWILHVDPVRRRARVCFAFYLAAACWKAAATALLSIGFFLWMAIKFNRQPNMEEAAANMMVLAIGVGLNTILGMGAIWAAIRYKIRVWVHPRLRRLVQDDLRQAYQLPPLRSGWNLAIFVVATALLFPAVSLGAAFCAWLSFGMDVAQVQAAWVGILTCLAVFGVPIPAVVGYAWLSSRIIARSPGECWPVRSFDDSGRGK